MVNGARGSADPFAQFSAAPAGHLQHYHARASGSRFVCSRGGDGVYHYQRACRHASAGQEPYQKSSRIRGQRSKTRDVVLGEFRLRPRIGEVDHCRNAAAAVATPTGCKPANGHAIGNRSSSNKPSPSASYPASTAKTISNDSGGAPEFKANPRPRRRSTRQFRRRSSIPGRLIGVNQSTASPEKQARRASVRGPSNVMKLPSRRRKQPARAKAPTGYISAALTCASRPQGG